MFDRRAAHHDPNFDIVATGELMQDDVFQRCLKIAKLLNAEQRWELANSTLYQYAQAIATRFTTSDGMSDVQLTVIVRNYHYDHVLVEGLLDPNRPEHAELWSDWTRQTLRILAAKTTGTQPPDAVVASREDLAQEALQDIWRGLANFNYQSSFHTWAFTVISHCLARHYRAQKTKKRGALPSAQSLDGMLEDGAPSYQPIAPSPDGDTFGTLLSELVSRTLLQHRDRRLAVVFHLWVNEEQTLRVISEQLSLSPARVHALLKQAMVLLQSQETIQQWAEGGLAKEMTA